MKRFARIGLALSFVAIVIVFAIIPVTANASASDNSFTASARDGTSATALNLGSIADPNNKTDCFDFDSNNFTDTITTAVSGSRIAPDVYIGANAYRQFTGSNVARERALLSGDMKRTIKNIGAYAKAPRHQLRH